MTTDRVTVSDLGERELIERIVARLDAHGEGEILSGDDAAVLAWHSPNMLLTTDLMVERVDFDLAWASGYDIGWKIVAVNASDIAAMGGTPSRAVVTLALSGDTRLDLADEVADGIAAASERFGIVIAGGDVSEGRDLALSLTLVGEPPAGGAVLRSGATVGDVIGVTGPLGGAAVGLIALQGALDEAPFEAAVTRQLRPEARLDAGRALARAGATAMIDLSDGLAVDLGHLTSASGVGCEVSPSDVPVHQAASALAARDPSVDAGEIAITGGEDFELLFTIPPAAVDGARRALEAAGCELFRIGEITASERLIGGRPLEQWRDQAWQHLRPR